MSRPRRVLLVANHACPCPELLDRVGELAAGGAVHVVAPALNSRLRHAVSDTDAATAAARARLEDAAAMLAERGTVSVTVEVGDADPLLALGDAAAVFPAETIVIATWPPERSNWLERDLVERVRARTDLPVEHVVTEYGLAERSG